MYRHKVHCSTILGFRDTRENRVFSNGGTNLHFYGSVIVNLWRSLSTYL